MNILINIVALSSELADVELRNEYSTLYNVISDIELDNVLLTTDEESGESRYKDEIQIRFDELYDKYYEIIKRHERTNNIL